MSSLAGEFCGQGIQKKVGVCQLRKMFVLFGVAIGKDCENMTWLVWDPVLFENIKDEEQNVFNVMQFGTWDITVPFVAANNEEEEKSRDKKQAVKTFLARLLHTLVWTGLVKVWSQARTRFCTQTKKNLSALLIKR